jgi:hypothetical protein
LRLSSATSASISSTVIPIWVWLPDGLPELRVMAKTEPDRIGAPSALTVLGRGPCQRRPTAGLAAFGRRRGRARLRLLHLWRPLRRLVAHDFCPPEKDGRLHPADTPRLNGVVPSVIETAASVKD